MKTLFLYAVFLVYSTAHAELMIFDVRKTLRMSESEPVYHDYYVNGGTELGMSTGMIITVTRKLPLYDTYQNRSAGDLQLKVAKVKIIHVQKGLSVARLQSEFSRDNAPLLEDNFIMVGDILDLATATSDRKSADNGESSKASEAAAAAAPASARSDKAVAQISVNAVDLSSTSSQKPSPEPTPVQNSLPQ